MRFVRHLFFICCAAVGFSSSLHPTVSQSNFVTYEFSGGRFGDNLLSYLHAKWISYRHQIPLLYKPFLYSSELALDDIEQRYCPGCYPKYEEIYVCEDSGQSLLSTHRSRLLICPYFPECAWERMHLRGPHKAKWAYFQVDWQDPAFRAVLKPLIALKHTCPLIIPPKNKISIAIHFREGGGYDGRDVGLSYLTKVPPLGFYIEGLLQVVKLFPGKSLYCYLFTDAQEPQRFLETFQNALPPETDLTFDCRMTDNAHDKNVLEDFFSFFEFDVLIHPQSNYSLVPSLIHDYAVTYSPLSGQRKGRSVVIDTVKFEVNEKLYKELIQ